MMPDILKEAKLQLLIALGAATPVILYSVGRWYKQWYFAQFRVHYGMFRFDAAYYMFGAWATMMVAISGILVLANLLFRFAVPGSFLARCIAIGLCILALSRLLIFKLEFNPNQFFTTKLLTSAEFSIACIGIAAFLHAVSSRALRRAADDMFMRVLSGSPLLWWIGLFLFWTYCMAVGYALGIYHGRKAIWEGKMGLQWVTIKGESRPWILVEQADDASVFVLDRERMVSRIVKREDIAEMGPLVTPGTTPEEVLKRFRPNPESAWEAPVTVHPSIATSLSIPADLARGPRFLRASTTPEFSRNGRHGSFASASNWRENAFAQAKREIAARPSARPLKSDSALRFAAGAAR